MSRRYIVKHGGGQYDAKDGDTIEADLDAAAEERLVANGTLVLAERKYKVTGPFEVCDAPPGDTFEAALPAGQEAALMAGGHIELAPGPTKKKGGKE